MISAVLNNADEQVPLAKKMVTGNKENQLPATKRLDLFNGINLRGALR